MTSNPYVEPYTYIGLLDISSDVEKYGRPIAVYAWYTSGASAPCHIQWNGYSFWEIKTLSSGDNDVKAYVTFSKHVQL